MKTPVSDASNKSPEIVSVSSVPSDAAEPRHQSQPQFEATHLFIRDATRIRGPFVIGAIQAMQQRGSVGRETLVSPDRVRWVAAGQLPDLFPPEFFARAVPATTSEMQWHFVSEGQKHGPVSWQELQTLAASGALQPLDSILPEGSQTWVPARSVTELQFRTDNDRLGLVRHKKLWLFSSTAFVVLLLAIPTVLMLTWDEGRIRRDNLLADREDAQSHDRALQEIDRVTKTSLANIDAATRRYEADRNAEALQMKLQTEERRFREEMQKMEDVASSNREVAAAQLQAAQQVADAEHAAADKITRSNDENTRSLKNKLDDKFKDRSWF